MELLQIVPRNCRIDVMTNMIIDVVPKETIHLVTHDGPGPFQLSSFPRGIVMLSNEPHAIQQGENISRNQPELEKSIEHPQFHRPENESRIEHDPQYQFSTMNQHLSPAKLLQRIEKVELNNGENSANENVSIKEEKIGKRPLPHSKGIGIFGGAIVVMVLKVIFFESDKSNNDRKGRENPKPPVFPSGLEEHAMGAVMHKRHNAHPQVSHQPVHEALDPHRGGVPRNISTANEHSVKKRNLEVVVPGMVVQLFETSRSNFVERFRAFHTVPAYEASFTAPIPGLPAGGVSEEWKEEIDPLHSPG